MGKELEVIETTQQVVQLETTKEKYEAIESDLSELQNNLISTAEKLSVQLPIAIELANAAQSDKIYTALAKLVLAYTDINKGAALIIKQKQELYDSFRVKNEEDSPQTINNDNRSIVFQGTANDLLNKIIEGDK